MSQPAPSTKVVLPQLGVWDVAAITAGIIIGAGIYESMSLVASQVAGPWELMAMWGVGGLLALNGALCYAELASAWPRQGGTYIYLNRAFGRWAGFFYVWSEFWIVRPGNIGAMAFIFAKYAGQMLPWWNHPGRSLALGVVMVVALGGLNLLGVRFGKGAQRLLTAAKVGSLLAIFAAGMWPLATSTPPVEVTSAAASMSETTAATSSNYFLALVLILFAYGGWNETAAVAAEVRDPRRNMLRGLVLGTVVVVATYLLVNYAALRVLGFGGLAASDAVVARLIERVLGQAGGAAVSAMVCVSCLGAINGMLFTGSRLYYALGVEEPAFAWLGEWNAQRGTPTRSLVLQTLVAVGLMLLFGWSDRRFEFLVYFTTPVFWTFLLLMSLAVMVLRHREPNVERPFRLRFYPLEPLLFCGTSLLLIYSGVSYLLSQLAPESPIFWMSLAAVVLPTLAGLVVYMLTRGIRASQGNLTD